MTSQKLTDRQQRVLRVLTQEWALAYDIAQKAEIDNRASGQVLKSLERRGLAESDVRAHPTAGKLWRRLG